LSVFENNIKHFVKFQLSQRFSSKQPPLKTVALDFRLAPKGHHIDFYNLGSIIAIKLNTDDIYLKSVFANQPARFLEPCRFKKASQKHL
tara:strand:+ start:230 stop:496 length:267 start_codon:yes stop_codon:yes gene_type:complete